jgi:hypothetical protein
MELVPIDDILVSVLHNVFEVSTFLNDVSLDDLFGKVTYLSSVPKAMLTLSWACW